MDVLCAQLMRDLFAIDKFLLEDDNVRVSKRANYKWVIFLSITESR